jgi:hypothetical protein
MLRSYLMPSNLPLAFMYEFCNDTKINKGKGGWLGDTKSNNILQLRLHRGQNVSIRHDMVGMDRIFGNTALRESG